jgi:putative flavoprotein involved in K+ transport
MYLRRGSGYYVDVGASDLITDGRVRLVPGQIKRITATGLEMQNGLALRADLIVYATGYKPMSASLAQLMGEDVAKKVGKCWGLGSGTAKDPGPWEGELRNMWKPTQQPNLWFHGGNLQQNRHYSQFLVASAQGTDGGDPNARVRPRASASRGLRTDHCRCREDVGQGRLV